MPSTTANTASPTLAQVYWPRTQSDAAGWLRAAILIALGVAAMAIAAKIRIPFWPVPATMQTFVLLTIGAAYGARLGFATILAYLAIGALGFDIFTSSSAESNGIAYMMGATGGYLIGFVLAAWVVGRLAEAGWDRSVPKTAAAMLIGSAVIYVPGVLWLGHLFADAKGWAWVMQVGFMNFVLADALKLALAALLLPALWRRKARLTLRIAADPRASRLDIASRRARMTSFAAHQVN